MVVSNIYLQFGESAKDVDKEKWFKMTKQIKTVIKNKKCRVVLDQSTKIITIIPNKCTVVEMYKTYHKALIKHNKRGGDD